MLHAGSQQERMSEHERLRGSESMPQSETKTTTDINKSQLAIEYLFMTFHIFSSLHFNT